MKLSIDLNADLGEGSGHDAELFELISSANIATGFHAGDSDTMHAAISAAKKQRSSCRSASEFFRSREFRTQGADDTRRRSVRRGGISTWNFSSDRLRTGCATESREAARRAL